jgi:hypothetical protein
MNAVIRCLEEVIIDCGGVCGGSSSISILTVDSLRGDGLNSVIVNALRADNRFRIKDGRSTYKLQIRPGIVSDCGTIIGCVFVDKNFDGEQQSDEPGVANAVIYMKNGNRITRLGTVFPLKRVKTQFRRL